MHEALQWVFAHILEIIGLLLLLDISIILSKVSGRIFLATHYLSLLVDRIPGEREPDHPMYREPK